MANYIGEILMRSGDTAPLLAVAVEDDMGVPVDLTGATSVVVKLINEDGDDPRAGYVAQPQSELLLPGTITSPLAGIVTYDWDPTMVLRPGVIQLVVEAEFPTGPLSAPSDRSALITMRPNVLFHTGGTVPFRYDLAIYRGDSYAWQFRLWQDDAKTIPVVLTDASAAAQIRDQPGGSRVVSMACVIDLPNTVGVTLAPESSQRVPNEGVWDLQLTFPGNQVSTAVNGLVTTTPDVTLLGR
jgi:hypothetical protein